MFTAKERQDFSVSRAMRQVLGRGGLSAHSGLEGEMLAQVAEEHGTAFSRNEFTLPWELLQRDFTAGVAGAAGGIGTDSQAPAVDLLRPVSLAAQAGVQILPGQQANISIPKAATSATAEWLPDEVSGITASDPTITELTGTPHYAGSVIKVSHQMGLQQVDSDFIGQHLLGLIGVTLDAAILAGSGADGQPVGLVNTTDVQAQAGANLAWSGISNMLKLSAEANGESTGFMSTPAVRDLLGQREKASGSGLIWSEGRIDGRPAFASTSCPAATLISGPWSEIMVPLWREGIALAVDDSTFFATGAFQVRVMLSADVIVRHPSSFVVASSIT